MKYLSICLSNLHDFITTEVLQKYKLKAEDMIERKVLTGEEYKTIIKMLFFLNYPTWRHENFDLIRKCNYLIKNNISELNANSIIVLNEVRHDLRGVISIEMCTYTRLRNENF